MREENSFSRTMMRQGWIIIAVMVALALISTLSSGNRPEPAPTIATAQGEFAVLSESPEVGFINGQNFLGKEVQYTTVEGLPVFEGDILLHFEDGDPLKAGVGVQGRTPRDFRWTNGLVFYEIDDSLPNHQRVYDAIAHWEANTKILFIQRTDEANYVRFQPGFGCSSYVGMVGGMQPIILARECSTGSTIHEIGHAVGLWHEQSRADRDQYITIHFENIISGAIFNFSQHIQDGQDLGAYDYASIMHYPRQAFSKNGKDTIVPKGDQVIGQRESLSAGDIAAVAQMYEGIITDGR